MSQVRNENVYDLMGQAVAKSPSIRTSARKLNLVAASIRGKSAAVALTQLAFEKRRVAGEVRKVLQAAIANAENNKNMDVDSLYVAEAWVGRALVMKRMHTRGRGRSAKVEKPFSNLTIVVAEKNAFVMEDDKADSKSAGEQMKKTDAVATDKTAGEA